MTESRVTSELSLPSWAAAGWALTRRALACRTTIGYAGLLSAGAVALAGRDAAGKLAWFQWASTNQDNLRHHPVRVLIVSAFLPGEHGAIWVLLAIIGLGSTEWLIGSVRTAVLAAAGQLIGTAVSEGILGYRVRVGDLPVAQRHIIDVGPSFVVVTGLASAVVLGPLWPRIIAAGCLAALAPSLLSGLTELDVAPVGHLCAAAIGVVGAGLAARRRSWRARGGRESPRRE